MSKARAPQGEFTGRHMFVLIFSFFAVVFAVNIGMAVVSATSWTGLVVANSYVASQEFEDKRLAHEAQDAAGWESVFTHADGVATLRVVDAAGRPVDLGTVTLFINRPVGGHDDQTLTLERGAGGTYGAPLALGPGVWEAHLAAPATALGSYELHERFSTKGD